MAGRKLGQLESALVWSTKTSAPTAYRVRPVIRMNLPPIWSDIWPAIGARTSAISDIGARISPALSAE